MTFRCIPGEHFKIKDRLGVDLIVAPAAAHYALQDDESVQRL